MQEDNRFLTIEHNPFKIVFNKMGGKSSAEMLSDTIFEMRISSKQLIKESQRCEKEEKQEKQKAMKNLEKGLIDIARINAENAIRKKNESLNYMKLSSKMDAVASRIQSATRTESMTQNFSRAIPQMNRVLKNMNLENISKTMNDFEKCFEDLDVASGYVNESLNQNTSVSAPKESVDNLLGEIASEHNIKVSEDLLSPGSGLSLAGGFEEKKTGYERHQ
jgi:charged multivesicular body protein 1